MGKISKRAKVVVAGTALLTAIGGGVAFAYWSTTGTGSGTATSSAGASSLTITQATAPADLAPGVAPEAVTGTITNKAANSAYVNTITVTITGVDSGHPTCSAADFGLTAGAPGTTALTKSGAKQTLTLNVQQELAATNGSVNFPAFAIGFANDPGSAQDGCKGATPQLSYATN